MCTSSILSGFTSLALRYVEKNDFENALRTFQLALSNVGRNCGVGDNNSPSHLKVNSTDVPVSLPEYGKSYCLVPIGTSEVCTESLLHLQGHSSLLTFYNQAFIVNDDTMDSSLISAMLLYNLAATTHYQGIVTNSTKSIHRATRLYRMTLCMLQNNEAASIAAIKILPLLLAVHNNMGHASLVLHSRDDYLWCINELQYMLEIFGPSTDLLPIDEISFSIALLNIYGNNVVTTAPCA